MSGPDPRASKSRYKTIAPTGSHQNGKHLLGPSSGYIPGSEVAHENESCDPEEKTKLMNVEAENQNKMDTPNVIEFEMESEDENVMNGGTNYDAGLMSAVSSLWSAASGSAAEHQFGDGGNHKLKVHGPQGATIYDRQDRHARRVRLTIGAGDPG